MTDHAVATKTLKDAVESAECVVTRARGAALEAACGIEHARDNAKIAREELHEAEEVFYRDECELEDAVDAKKVAQIQLDGAYAGRDVVMQTELDHARDNVEIAREEIREAEGACERNERKLKDAVDVEKVARRGLDHAIAARDAATAALYHFLNDNRLA